MKQYLATLAWAALAVMAGCNAPTVEFLEMQESAPTARDGAEVGVAFDCVVRARAIDQEQLVYRVNILDARGRPLGSYNRMFSDSRGHVAAQRTFVVGMSAVEEHRLRVTIPIEELEVTPDDMPIGVLYGIYRANDERLFAVRRQVRLPARAKAALQQYFDRRFSLPQPTSDESNDEQHSPPADPGPVGPPPPDENDQALSPADVFPVVGLLVCRS